MRSISIGKKAMLCLREPSLGPSFGMKGGAAGGGYAQVVPMEDINLHFTGDFHAITSANNLLAALLDNHIYWGNALGIDQRRVTWRRVLDMNDRALREIVNSLGGAANGYPREDGFDITVASEVMAIFCLASDLDDLRRRLGNIIVAYTRDKKPVRAGDLKAQGAMTALLKDALVAQPGADARRHAGLHSWRTVRQHRARLQFRAGHDDGVEAGGLCGDRSGLRRRSGRREVPRHQVPQGRPRARLRRAGRHHPRAENARRREEGRSQEGRSEGARDRHEQPALPRRERAQVRARAGHLDQPLQRRLRRGDRAGQVGVHAARRRVPHGRPLGDGRRRAPPTWRTRSSRSATAARAS